MEEYAYLGFPPEAIRVDQAAFRRLPESARRVFETVVREGVVTHEHLRHWTGMSPRTIRFAVKRLRDETWIEARQSLRDGRICYFFVHPVHVDEDALRRARARARDDAERMGRTIEIVGDQEAAPGGAYAPRSTSKAW